MHPAPAGKSVATKRTFARRAAIISLAVAALDRPAHALTFNLTYNSTVTNLGATTAAEVEGATQYAAQQIENMVPDAITVNVTVDASAANNFLGEAGPGLQSQSYSTVRNDLIAKSQTPIDSLAVASLPSTNPLPSNSFWVPTAEEKVLGMIPANNAPSDGTFTFSTAFPYTYGPSNGQSRAVGGSYDFVGVAEHELTHLLGRVALVGQVLGGSSAYTPLDLFRYESPGARSVSTSDPAPYFSVDSGNTNLKGWAPSGDLADWAGTSPYDPDSFNAATASGIENDITPVDLAELDTMGYTPTFTARTLTWDGTTNPLNSSHWIGSSTLTLYTTYIGASLTMTTGGEIVYAPTTSDTANVDFSSTSIQGTSLSISSGTFLLDNTNGISGHAYYLALDNGGSLSVSGTTTYSGNVPVSSPSNVQIGGGLIVGNLAGSTASATFTGGITNVGLNSPPDPTLYVGDFGTGTLTQSGTAYIGTPTLNIAAQTASTGTYTITGGVLFVSGSIFLGGRTNGSGGITPGGTATFNLGSSAVVTAANVLTAGSGTVAMTGGSLAVSGTLSLSSGFTFNVSGGTLSAGSTTNATTINQTGGTTVLGSVSGTGSLIVGNSSGASARMTASGLNQSIVTVNSTGLFTLNGGSANTVTSLKINGNGKFDLTNHHLFIDYGSGADPIASIAAYIKSGFNTGAWTGTGIFSTNAQSNSISYGIGYADAADPGNPAGLASGQIEIAYTLLGDANLDGKVNGTDFNILVANFNTGGDSWDQGDFNYDGKVNGSDFNLLAANFNQGATQSAVDLAALDSFAAANGFLADVPEPASLGMGIVAFGFFSTARRRRR